ncbi:Twin-arginine translocation pathway signal sequence domain protein, putative [Ketogulonicigenium robustum]|uniref:Twin-arginine translocation pathway signal sequence domain protein, putative n=1 Tax=Ketogulonicigenium robustum TaxID=92947 RepID=A0A1W6NY61_9RHOB|nr:YSC84-related protein [Ketogulonicigenium robustum]ARO14185.1 Twin-arginine translocation pathway signal sequence domain protein, putative [Ketogulonicigenium robustum]
MTQLTRRGLTLGLGAFGLTATGLTAACNNGIGSGGAAEIDARADSTVAHMLQAYPGTQDLMNRAAGMLVMPVMTEVGLGLGGSYGRGALRIQQVTVDYYSAASASAGFQIGAQQYSHVLFFMSQESLGQFRTSYGWAAGADIDYAIAANGDMLRAETTTSMAPVIAVVFAQSGLRVGATIEGTKYTRIIP